MKVMKSATFKFRFKEVKTKTENDNLLQEFLTDNDWLDSNGRKKAPLYSYHSSGSDFSEIVLAEEEPDGDFINLINELFESIVTRDDIKWVKTIYNDYTFNIVHKEAGKYLQHQTIDLSDLKDGDEVVVFLSKK